MRGVTRGYDLTAADQAELADIEAAVSEAAIRRRRFWAKIRQRRSRANRKDRTMSEPANSKDRIAN